MQGIGWTSFPWPHSDFWPTIRMNDGTYRKGPQAEIVGRWR